MKVEADSAKKVSEKRRSPRSEKLLHYRDPHVCFIRRIDNALMGKWFLLLVLAKGALVLIPIFSMMLPSTIGFFDSYYYAIESSFRFGGAFMKLRPDRSCI